MTVQSSGKAELGTVMVVSGPSGSGKSSICREVRKVVPELCFSVSCTTRKPRPGETDCVDYFFLEKEDFECRIAAGEFLEYAQVFDNYYGTLYSEVAERVKDGKIVFLDIDVQGAMQIKERAKADKFLARCLEMVFVSPPSFKVLEARLRGRGTETEEVIQKRLAEAGKEMGYWSKYSYLIVNDDLERAAEEMHALIRSFGCATRRMKDISYFYE